MCSSTHEGRLISLAWLVGGRGRVERWTPEGKRDLLAVARSVAKLGSGYCRQQQRKRRSNHGERFLRGERGGTVYSCFAA